MLVRRNGPHNGAQLANNGKLAAVRMLVGDQPQYTVPNHLDGRWLMADIGSGIRKASGCIRV